MTSAGAHYGPMTSAHVGAPTSTGYYEDPLATIRRLEAELEAARAEIERLRGRLAESEKERNKHDAPKVQSRYWTPNEHKRFLEALQKFGAKDVRAIASYVGSRNATQVRTHAQKYFLRVAREAKAGSALQAARKRSMSESDLARVGRAVGTPPGSPSRERDADQEHSSPAPMSGAGGPSPSPFTMGNMKREEEAIGGGGGDIDKSGEDGSHDVEDVSMSENGEVLRKDELSIFSLGGRPRGGRVASTGTLSSLVTAPPAFGAGVGNRRDADMEGTTNGGAADDKSSASSRDLGTAGAIPPLPPNNNRSITHVSASKPPVASPNVTDTSGINLLSLVASERKMEAESGMSN